MTLATLAQVACTQPTSDSEDITEAHQPQVTTNALLENALLENALLENSLVDPNARELFKYIVSCALPEDAQISIPVEGVTYTFDGKLGLAPEWGEEGGSCDEECRSWISGCVISRLDYLGEHVLISVRGKNSGLASTPQERAEYSHIEATYYGDIFSHPQKIFACLPPGKSDIPRVCGPSLDDCAVDVQGSCEDLCGNQRNDGSYPNCREAGTVDKHGKVHKGEKHVGSVTVFLK
jgi:hypothetical protein